VRFLFNQIIEIIINLSLVDVKKDKSELSQSSEYQSSKGRGVTQNQKNEASSNAFCNEISKGKKSDVSSTTLAHHHKTIF
jgi:hypothetical protein